MGITGRARVHAPRDGELSGRLGGASGVGFSLENSLDDVALDEFAFATGAAAKGVVSDAVDVTERAGNGFVEDSDSVGSEEFLCRTGCRQASADVVSGVF